MSLRKQLSTTLQFLYPLHANTHPEPSECPSMPGYKDWGITKIHHSPFSHPDNHGSFWGTWMESFIKFWSMRKAGWSPLVICKWVLDNFHQTIMLVSFFFFSSCSLPFYDTNLRVLSNPNLAFCAHLDCYENWNNPSYLLWKIYSIVNERPMAKVFPSGTRKKKRQNREGAGGSLIKMDSLFSYLQIFPLGFTLESCTG